MLAVLQEPINRDGCGYEFNQPPHQAEVVFFEKLFGHTFLSECLLMAFVQGSRCAPKVAYPEEVKGPEATLAEFVVVCTMLFIALTSRESLFDFRGQGCCLCGCRLSLHYLYPYFEDYSRRA